MLKLLLILLIAACSLKNKNDNTIVPKNQTYNKVQGERKMPEYNKQMIQRLNVQGSANNYNIKSDAAIQAEYQAKINKINQNNVNYDDAQNKNNNLQNDKLASERIMQKQKSEEVKIEFPILSPKQNLDNKPQIVYKEELATLQKQPKAAVLEIDGNQGKVKPKLNNYIILTSPSYDEVEAKTIKYTLESFGDVKEVQKDDKYYLTIENNLQTEEEAKVLLDKIIKSSFFDVYIKKL